MHADAVKEQEEVTYVDVVMETAESVRKTGERYEHVLDDLMLLVHALDRLALTQTHTHVI